MLFYGMLLFHGKRAELAGYLERNDPMNRKELYQNHKSCMAAHTFLLLMETMCISLSANLLAAFVDVLSAFSYQAGVRILEKLCIVFAAQLLCLYVKGRYWTACRQRRTNDLECSLYTGYLASPLHSDSESRLSIICEKDIPECVGFYTEKLPSAVQAVAGLLAYSFLLTGKEHGLWIVGLLLALGIVQFLPPLITEKYLVQNYTRAGQAEEEVRQELISGLSGMLTIKMLNLHHWFMERYLHKQKKFSKVGEQAAGTSSVQSALYSGASLVQQLGFLLLGSFLAAKGSCSMAVLIEGYALSSSFYQYMARLGSLKADRGTCRAAEERIFRLFREEDSCPLSFDGLEMELPAKGIWLLKGANGAGKSTLFSILSGCRTSKARITRDAQPLSPESLREMTGWCPQIYLPISDSFRELLEIIPKGTINPNHLQACLREFDVDSGLLDRPMNKLSGGQQKKLALVLALSKNCSILLLDEPEASLDQAGIENLKRLLEQESRPVLLVTHDSSVGGTPLSNGTPLSDGMSPYHGTHTFYGMASGIISVEGGRVYVQKK